MSKQFWGVILVVIAVLGGIFWLTGNKSSTTNTSAQVTNHVQGAGTKKVTLLEYGDYECPYCEQYSSTVKQVLALYGDQITFQFRNFPLVSIHPNAFAGARAAEAAGLQGKFWEMHDMLYNPSDWQQWSTASDPTPYFQQFANTLGLNVKQFDTDFASSKVNNIVNADLTAANKLGLSGTPSFFLDGKQVQIANSVAAFQKVIDAEITLKNPTN